MIRFACPTCQTSLKVPPNLAGKLVPCPRCDDKIKIPMKSDEEGAAKPKPAPTAARIALKPKPVEEEAVDDGFEVIDDEPKLKAKPTAAAESAPVVKAKPKKSIVVADDRDDDEDEEDEPVRRKKKKKKRKKDQGFFASIEDVKGSLIFSSLLMLLYIIFLAIAEWTKLPVIFAVFHVFAVLFLATWSSVFILREGGSGGLAICSFVIPFLILFGPSTETNAKSKIFGLRLAFGYMGTEFIKLLLEHQGKH